MIRFIDLYLSRRELRMVCILWERSMFVETFQHLRFGGMRRIQCGKFQRPL
jgi:hypothetical protein